MYEYDFHTYSVRKRSSKKRPLFFIICLCLILFFVYSLFIGEKKIEKKSDNTALVSGVADYKKEVLQDAGLGEQVKEALSGTSGSYAVVIQDTKNKQSYALNEHRVYNAGSLYKLWVMAVVYQQIQAGKLSEDMILEADIASLNEKFHIASESAELTEGKVSFTVASALRQMITISHNYAALLLAEKVRLSTVATFLEKNGLHATKVGRDGSLPTTTASDIRLFFDLLYQGKLANVQYTQEMIELLKAQRLNNNLPVNFLGSTPHSSV